MLRRGAAYRQPSLKRASCSSRDPGYDPVMRRFLIVLCLFASAAAFPAASPAVAKAFVDSMGSVHIVTEDGGEQKIGPEKWQDGGGFSDVSVASDGRTVGWVANQMLSPLAAGANDGYAVAVNIDVWRDGKVIQRLSPDAYVIRNWLFLKNGEEVAIHTAPLHGQDFFDCTRFDARTGRKLAHWSLDRRNYVVPEWAKPLLVNDPPPGPDEISDWFPRATNQKQRGRPLLRRQKSLRQTGGDGDQAIIH